MLAGHEGIVNAVAVTSDGLHVVSGSEDQTREISCCWADTGTAMASRHKGTSLFVGILPPF